MATRKQSTALAALVGMTPVKQGPKRVLSGVDLTKVRDDMLSVLPSGAKVTEADASGLVGMVASGLAAQIKAAQAALTGLSVDPSKVTLRSVDGSKVTANLPVPFVVDGQTRYLNLSVSFDGAVGQILAAQSERVAKPTKAAPTA